MADETAGTRNLVGWTGRVRVSEWTGGDGGEEWALQKYGERWNEVEILTTVKGVSRKKQDITLNLRKPVSIFLKPVSNSDKLIVVNISLYTSSSRYISLYVSDIAIYCFHSYTSIPSKVSITTVSLLPPYHIMSNLIR